MIDKDLVVKDGDAITVGDTTFTVYETPGHTLGTASYSFPVRDGPTTYQALTVGGLGLNAIQNSTLHLTPHPFSNGLTEAAERLKLRQAGEPHPLSDPAGLLAQLAGLRKGAEERLVIERNAGR